MRDRALQGIGIPGDAGTVAYMLLGLAAEKYPADATTDAMARFLKLQQTPGGFWLPLAHRPPIEAVTVMADVPEPAPGLATANIHSPEDLIKTPIEAIATTTGIDMGDLARLRQRAISWLSEVSS